MNFVGVRKQITAAFERALVACVQDLRLCGLCRVTKYGGAYQVTL